MANAAGVNINATATVSVGSKSFSATFGLLSLPLEVPELLRSFDIDVEAFTTSGSSSIEIELAAQAVLFSVPAADAKLEFMQGSEDEDSSLEATIPLMDIFMVEPEVEGFQDVYLAVRLDSPWGLSTAAARVKLPSRSTVSLFRAIPLKQRWAIPFVSHGRGRVLQAGMKPSTSRLS